MQPFHNLVAIAAACAAAVFSLLLLVSPLQAADAALTALAPQPEASAIEPGLAVSYYYAMFKYVSEVDGMAAHSSGKVGDPIARLDMRTTGEVFGSHATEGVGLEINGLIRFPSAGAWKLVVLSNDGVRVTVADKVVLEDPDVHSDRYSDPATVTVPAAGWYKLAIAYFQRHASSALQLSWKPPGGSDFALIPADAYAHLKSVK